jgi:type IV secretion system protein VirB10
VPALDLTPPDGPKVRRLDRLPIFVAIGLVAVFLAAVFWRLTTSGL